MDCEGENPTAKPRTIHNYLRNPYYSDIGTLGILILICNPNSARLVTILRSIMAPKP